VTLRRTLAFHNDRLRKHCLTRQVPLVELCGKLRAEDFDDPFHPNERGAQIVAREVFRVLSDFRATEGSG
jgi:hypothetical protein